MVTTTWDLSAAMAHLAAASPSHPTNLSGAISPQSSDDTLCSPKTGAHRKIPAPHHAPTAIATHHHWSALPRLSEHAFWHPIASPVLGLPAIAATMLHHWSPLCGTPLPPLGQAA
jgi:hypothetical protein